MNSHPGEAVSELEAAALPFGCSGSVYRAPPAWFENLELSVTPYFCAGPNGVVEHKVDPGGYDWRTWDDLRLAEHNAFATKYHRLARDLRERIAKAGETAPLLADVWFVTRQEDDEQAARKDVLLSLSDTERDEVLSKHRAAVATRGQEVTASIQKLSATAVVLSESPAFTGGGPLLQVIATAPELRAIGDQDGIVFVGLGARLDEDVPTTEAWYDIGGFWLPTYYGVDGDGVSVVDVLGTAGVYDVSYLSLAGGGCVAQLGTPYLCYCSASSPTTTAPTSCGGGHMQHVLSVIKNSWPTLRGGAARHARMLAGNVGAGCTPGLENVIPWATGQGASVINRSATNGLSASRYLDYVATVSPWPTPVAAGGNHPGIVESLLRNGPVVGGVDDHGSTSRTQLTMWGSAAWMNYSGSWELPHLVAPAVNIDTVSNFPAAGLRGCSGTSFAAPQVSGTIASLQEAVPLLKSWPEAVLPILMVSAFTNAAPAGPDGSSFSLIDAVDDKDGAGALSASGAWQAAIHRDGGDTGDTGFDYGFVSSNYWPAGTDHPEVWSAYVPAGAYLRVASVLFNHPTCGSPATQNNCTSDGFPRTILMADGPSGTSYSISWDNNYQYVVTQNTTGSAYVYSIRLYMWDWQGMSYDTFGVAWSSR